MNGSSQTKTKMAATNTIWLTNKKKSEKKKTNKDGD